MDKVRFQRIETLFHQLLELEDEERQDALAGEEDPAVRRKVAELLAVEVGSSQRLDQIIAESAAQKVESLNAPPPEQLGPYRILGELGRGGFATVYLAERSDGAFSLRVAIKLVRSGLHRDVLERLHREREFLARLQHPNIARILDGGSTPDGVPFVVMELIEGEPIHLYCQKKELDLEARLDLFRQVCDAVRFAHQNLILHRDIKPSNILVGADGVPKLLDFGIAKVLDLGGNAPQNPNGTAGTFFNSNAIESTVLPTGPNPASSPGAEPLTRLGIRVLTPEFASPEQIRGEPLDTRTDIYSLGVVLYLLLTEQHPHSFEGASLAEIEEILNTEIPPPPSALRNIRRPWTIFGDDLDKITLKALHKNPQERYASVGALAEDLRRHQAGLPIRARPNSIAYRGWRFFRRHAVALSLAFLVGAALITATLITHTQYRLAEKQRQRSDRATQFLKQMLESSTPYEGWEPNITARQAMEQGARQMRWELQDDPELRAELMILLGQVFRSLADYEQAEQNLIEGLEILHALPSDVTEQKVTALRDLGHLYRVMGRCEPARIQLEASRNLALDRLGAQSPEFALSLYQLGTTLRRCGEIEEGERLLHDALELRREIFGSPSEELSEARIEIARAQLSRGAYDKAQAGFEQALEELHELLPPYHPEFATLLSDLAVLQERRGDPGRALELYREALSIQEQSLGERHDALARTLHNIGAAEMARREWQASEEALQAALKMLDELHAGDHPLKATCLYSLGRLKRASGDWQGAADLLAQSLEARIRLYGEDHELISQSRFALARVIAKHDPRRAEELYRQIAEQLEHILPAGDFRLSYPLFRWGVLHFDQGNYAEAEPLLRRAFELRRTNLPQDSWETAVAAGWLGRCLGQLGRLSEARELLERGIEQLDTTLGSDDTRSRDLRQFLEDLAP